MSRWQNAPVVYVIVQVRFSPVLSLSTYLPQIQEHFRRNDFPAFGTRFNFQLAASMPQSSEPEPMASSAIPIERSLSYVFSNRDRNRSFVLEQNGLTLQVTDYEDFNWFMELFVSHLDQINGIIRPDSSERIGIRYIDAVLPDREIPITDYLIPSIFGLSQQGLEGTLQHTYSETIMVNHDISTVSRVFVRDGLIAFPPDMVSLPVSVSPRFTGFKGLHAVLDTDSFQAVPTAMDIPNVRAKLTQLHDAVDGAFQTIATKFALNYWKGDVK